MTTKVRGKQKKMIGSEIPSFDVFREDIKKIYPEGDLSSAYNRLLWFINNETVSTDGTQLTYALIMEKFASHIRQWNMKYGSRDPKYIGKEDEEKRKNLYDFIGMKGYEREFMTSSGQGERNKYLFGDFPIDYLSKQLERFKKRFPDETDKSTD